MVIIDSLRIPILEELRATREGEFDSRDIHSEQHISIVLVNTLEGR